MIKAVIFDVDGVLLDSLQANLQFFQSLLSMEGYKPPTKEAYSKLLHLPMYDLIKVLTKASDDEVKRICEIGISGEVPSVEHLLVMPEGAKETVLKLGEKYTLGIVTSRIKEKIYVAGLSELKQYFAVTVGYQDTTNHKPHPEPLLLAGQKLGINPEEAVYIGDTESDSIAGKAAGMKVIAYTQNIYRNTDAHTYTFRDLPDIIEKLV